MSNHTETTEAAVSALRRYADTVRDSGGAITVSLDALRELADRIEAAAARERAHEIELAKLRAPGNAAALRHALGIVYDWILKAGNVHGYPDTEQKRRQLYDMMTEALSAPPRNCDRFATTAAAAVAFRHARPDLAGEDFAYNFVAWLFAPAQEGAEG